MSIDSGAAESTSGGSCVRCAVALSRAMITRSPTSSGSALDRPSSVRKPYSGGSARSPPRYITLSLPRVSSASFIARIDPRASPSGFSWVTRRKRSLARIASATALSSLPICGQLVDQLAHPDALLHRAIVFEGQLRGPLHSQLVGEPRLEHAVGGGEPVQGRPARLLRTEHADEDACMPEIRGRLDAGDGH